MTIFYLVQHGEKDRSRFPGDPGLTEAGWWQGVRTGAWLRTTGVVAVYSSPLRRAMQTAELIASACGVNVRTDPRLRERMNWDGSLPWPEFLVEWDRTVTDRDYTPSSGDSSRQAGERLADFLVEHQGCRGPVAMVVHGGVTVDLLRTLLGDAAVPAELLSGVPSCAITKLDGLEVTEIASVTHLTSRPWSRPGPFQAHPE
ncbi:histidine phosphatase family protein [Actinomadura miaoliensis]|uniref:2,3-diphosphoglycerate-dependent phosphoglycerate mutase GpmB n=1 Tax=Actinomadura miaoliensis TaxID=430685 RepID=A0ABP7UYX1_9ACTN